MVPGSGPEAVYDRAYFSPQPVHGLQDYPLEVAYSDSPVPAHDPYGYPPELVHESEKFSLQNKPAQGFGTEEKGSVKEIEKNDTTHSRPHSRKKWLWVALVVLAVVIIGAGVGLGVGLTVGRKSRFVKPLS